MTSVRPDAQHLHRSLRLWPGIAIAVTLLLLRFAVPVVFPDAFAVGLLGSLACGLLVVLWWAFLSRAPVRERWGAVVLMIAAMLATTLFLHESIATGAMGMLFPILAIPGLSVAFVLWAVVSRRLSATARWATMAATIVLACGAWVLVRTGGFTADFDNDLHWRWAPTAEERLLARAVNEQPAVPPTATTAAPVVPETPAAPVAKTETVAPPVVTTPARVAEWPGFRGPQRTGILNGVRIETDWTASPPVELWRRPVGPGWSSFAVEGDRLYTQEQRGEEESVSCHHVSTGELIWRHSDTARFWESNAGAGPRATPTLSGGRVYTLGATGILNALDAATGAVVWSRNAVSDTGAKIPVWGISGSPLVRDDLVIVSVSGFLAGYDRATGEPRWSRRAGGGSYSSPQLVTIAGVPQVLFLSGAGAVSVAPADGIVLWEHPWPGSPIVQPVSTAEGDVLVSVSESEGTRRLAITRKEGGAWSAKERWTTRGLKPYFNDFVVHRGHAFGFDGSILACINLEDGQRKWKGGRYGHGQLLLLPDQDLLVVLSEQGELALVRATPDQHTELARIPAIEGKTWNHPVLAGDTLLVRNGEEMAAFRVPLAEQ
jgi:outer membrane protein assembly factor BamB